ncbi:MAG: TCR/Tet family MFS transporter [Planctomycetota bacterium]
MTEPSAPQDDGSAAGPYRPPGDATPVSGDESSRADGKTPAHGNRALAFILLTLFIDILGIGIVIPVLPELVKQLIGGDETAASAYVGLIASAYAVMQFFCAPMLGALSDRFGRRPVLIIALFGLGIDFIVQGFANSVFWLLVARMIGGAMGASVTTANAYIADISNDDTRARNFGLVGVMFGLGFIFGPALGGSLGEINLRLPFFVAAGLALSNAVYGFFVLPESLPKDLREPIKLSSMSPIGSLRVLRQYPLVMGLAVVVTIKAFAQRGLENVWVLYTAAKFDWSKATNGFFLGWVGVTALIVQGGLVRPTVRRFGERRVLLFATAISAIAFAGYATAPQGWMLPLIITFGGLGGLAGPAVQSLITSTVDEREQGRVQGALTCLQSLTAIAAPLFFTAGLFQFFSDKSKSYYFPGAPLLAGSILIVIAGLVALRVVRRN